MWVSESLRVTGGTSGSMQSAVSTRQLNLNTSVGSFSSLVDCFSPLDFPVSKERLSFGFFGHSAVEHVLRGFGTFDPFNDLVFLFPLFYPQ